MSDCPICYDQEQRQRMRECPYCDAAADGWCIRHDEPLCAYCARRMGCGLDEPPEQEHPGPLCTWHGALLAAGKVR